jgi:trans-aconitate methyltransferase
VTTAEVIRVSPDWLALREPADAAARSRALVDQLLRRVPTNEGWLIHDLACGTGSMGRWLAPLLPGAQRWVLHDRDADLLACASADAPGPAADGAEVAVETRLSDLTQLERDDLAGATLITASALLDLLTREELTRLIDVCAGAGCPVLFALSVSGRVQLLPPDPLDARIAAAFNEHQRRLTPRGRLLGPAAVEAAVEGFRETGAEVAVSSSPWQLGATDGKLAHEWITGWIDAACEQEPELVPEADPFRRRRLNEAAAGALAATVGHADLLVLP